MPEAMTTRRVTGRDVGSGQGVSVTVADGRIAAIEPTDLALTSGPYLAVGLIDLQVNGFRGLDLNDGMVTPARVAALTQMMTGLGVTTYLPTLITASRASPSGCWLISIRTLSISSRTTTAPMRSRSFCRVRFPTF